MTDTVRQEKEDYISMVAFQMYVPQEVVVIDPHLTDIYLLD